MTLRTNGIVPNEQQKISATENSYTPELALQQKMFYSPKQTNKQEKLLRWKMHSIYNIILFG